MPNRSRPGRRDRIEAALSPTLRAALQELRELLNVFDWQASPLAAPFQQAAVILLAAELASAGRSERTALEEAAAILDVSSDTVRSRATRWPRESRRDALCTARVPADPPILAEGLTGFTSTGGGE